jgi:ketosteroid isomerase-like protein
MAFGIKPLKVFYAMTRRPSIVAIGIMGTLGLMGDLQFAAADSFLGPPRSRSTAAAQVPATANAPVSTATAPSPTPEAGANQGRAELRFVAVEIEGVKLWLGGGDVDVREFRGSKVITFRILNKLDGDHGFAIDALKIKQVLKPGDEVAISVSLEDFDQSVSVYRYYCQLHPSHWGGTGVIAGKDTPPPRAASAALGTPKIDPVRGKDVSAAKVPDEVKTETEILKGKLLKIEKGFYVIESAPSKEVRVSAPLDAATDENGKSLMGEWVETQISSDLHVTGIKRSLPGYAIDGELVKAEGDVYIVADGPGKNVQLRLTKDTKVEGTYKIGDRIKAEFTPDGNVTFISKKVAPIQEVLTASPAEKPVRPVQEVLKLDRDWASALVRRDTRSLERAMADNGIATAWNIEVLNKPQYLAEIASGDFAFKSIEIDEAKVRVYGDAVLVTGRYTVKGRYKEQDISGQHRYTNLYVKQQGAWRLVSQNVHPQSP